MISIVLPTLHGDNYTNWCLKSLRENTVNDIQILVHGNEGSPELEKICKQWDVDYYQRSNFNLGIAKPTNELAARATGEYIMYTNNDIYSAPGWDVPLLNRVNDDIFYQYLTPVMFERQFNNPSMNAPMDFGDAPENFREEEFIETWRDKRKITEDIISTWGPPFMKKALWDHVGGFCEDYFPGWGTDSDLVATIYNTARDYHNPQPHEFRGVSDCGLYHIQSVGLNKVKDGAMYQATAIQIFQRKWGMGAMDMYKMIGDGNKID